MTKKHPVGRMSPGKRPSYQWYPGDIKRDTALQACPFMARAIWREMLDIMHDGEPRGYLTAGGKPIDSAELAMMIGGVTAKQVQAALDHLRARNVYSVTDDGVIYSRRMVKDEGVILARIEGGKNAPQPNAKETPSTPPLPPPSAAPLDPPPAFAFASASAQHTRRAVPEGDEDRMENFLEWWRACLSKHLRASVPLVLTEKDRGHAIRLLGTYPDALLYAITEEYAATTDKDVRSKPPCLGLLAYWAPMIEGHLKQRGAA